MALIGPGVTREPAADRASDRIGRALLLLLAAMIPTVPFPSFRITLGSFFFPYAAAPMALLAYWSALRPTHSRAISQTAKRCSLTALAFGGWATLSVMVSGYPQLSRIASLLFYVAACSIILGLGSTDDRMLYQASTLLASLLTAAVLYGLYQLAEHQTYWFEFAANETGTRNFDAFLIATVFPVAFARAIVSGIPVPVRMLAAAVAAVFVAAILLSLSRSSTAGLAAAALLTLIAGYRIAPMRLRTLVVLGALSVTALLVLQGYFQGHELSLARFSMLTESRRLPLAQSALHTGLQRPFTGIGYFNFTNSNLWGEDAHDAYLNLFAETGIIGMCLFAALFAIPLAGYIRVLRRLPLRGAAPQIRVLYLQGLGMLVSIALLAATDTFYKSIYFWIAYCFAIMPLAWLDTSRARTRYASPAGDAHA
jgi:O-antigen ligase